MSLFSKRKSPPSTEPVGLPEQVTPVNSIVPTEVPHPSEASPWTMTEAQYNELHRMLDRILDNQVIAGNNAKRLEAKVDALHSDMRVSIDNELLLIRRQDDQSQDIRQIKHTVNR